jgi:DNA-binding transcriptional LysR family regulator
MRINLNQLRSFFLVAREKSVTKAAKLLFITQPAVTMQIKSLEQDLEIRLFKKYGKSLQLTHAGEVLLGYAERVFEIVEEMEYVLRGHAEFKHGALSIGTTRSFAKYLMPEMLSRYQKRYPSVKVALNVGSSQEIADGVMAYKYDLGIIGRLPFKSKLKVIPYSKTPFSLVTSADHKLAGLGEVSLEVFKKEPLIIREEGSGSRYAILSMLSSHGINPNVLIEAESIEFIKEYIIKGKGVSFLYRPEVHMETNLGLLKEVRIKEGPLTLQTDIVYPRNVDLSPLAQTFLRLIEGEEI